jgi:hypothetical protein
VTRTPTNTAAVVNTSRMSIYLPIVLVIVGCALACVLCGCSGTVHYDHGDQHVEIDWTMPTTQPTPADTTPQAHSLAEPAPSQRPLP